MKTFPLFQVNAFTDSFSGGNPAGVVFLSQFLDGDVMQAIAKENGFSETAFLVRQDEGFAIRWFTPGCEVDLCGHATIGAAHAVLSYDPSVYSLKSNKNPISFYSKSGELQVEIKHDKYYLEMPLNQYIPCPVPRVINDALGGIEITESFKADDYLFVLPDYFDLGELKPKFHFIKQLNTRGVIVSTRSSKYDFESRWFGGHDVGIDEDPVTGSAHRILTQYWSKKLQKNELSAFQRSSRGGFLQCELGKSSVKVAGEAVTYFKGHITI